MELFYSIIYTLYKCVCKYINTHVHMPIQIYIYIYIHTHTYAYTNIYIHIHIYIHIYIYIYTNMIKISGKVDKSNTYNRFSSNILFFIHGRTFSD